MTDQYLTLRFPRLAFIFLSVAFFNQSFLFSQTLPVVPEPQEVRWKTGKFTPKTSYTIRIGAKDKSHVLKDQVEEILENSTLLTDKNDIPDIWIGIPNKDPLFLDACLSQTMVPDPRWGAEGYSLFIAPNQILLAAHKEAGLFYGLQTLRQILRAYGSQDIPCLQVNDWPAFTFRGVMDDISRGPLPNLDFQKAQIRRLAEMKINVFTFYIEHVIKTKKHGSFSPADGITIEEWQELADYAQRYNIQLLGSFQSLGHASNILRFPQYQHLGATPRMFKPGDPEVIEFITDVYDEMIPVFPSEYFAVNGDEAWDLGRGELKAKADEVGVAKIYADHMTPLIKHVKKRGKRPLMWGDIALSHPEVLDMIPRNTLIGTWDYSAFESFAKFIDPFVAKKFDFIVCTGVLNSHRVMPDFYASRINIRNFVNEGYDKGATGVLNCVWDDGGRHFFTRDWYGVAYGADQSWNPRPVDETFDGRFSNSQYADSSRLLPELLHELNELAELGPTQEMNSPIFWQQLIPEKGQQLVIDVSGWKEVEDVVRRADSLLKLMDGELYAEELPYWKFTVKQYQWMADARQFLIAAANMYAEASKQQLTQPDQAKELLTHCLMQIQMAKDASEELKEAFTTLWKNENRNYWLEDALMAYEERQDRFNQLELRVKTAKNQFPDSYLPAPDEVQLAISEASGQYFTYWLITGPFPITEKHVQQPDFLKEMGGEANARPVAGTPITSPSGKPLRWEKVQSPLFDQVDLKEMYQENEQVVAYAYCQIESSKDEDVTATFGSNDGIEIWCNGERIFQKYMKRSLIPDEDTCILPLKKGNNHVLVKIAQWKAGWGFSFRLPEKIVRNHKHKYQVLR